MGRGRERGCRKFTRPWRTVALLALRMVTAGTAVPVTRLLCCTVLPVFDALLLPDHHRYLPAC